ncbi:tetratricopeptide repeat protein [Microvirga sp. ACRRW]|uniref:tetratricopeptide repeat protein n=1 Tax=Microvirga sp. ACRRW TaxID=2918205 RepID=UPI001EF4EB2E|nr:tetratricopeptide repeat protein [Microvirga sp. ACRRW]MCG7394098.1 tetratricopeptide repeat protein [Microvirga sp. ACRRW]
MKPGSQQSQMPLQQALASHQAGKIEQAKSLYKKILLTQPRQAEVLRLLGTAEYQLGNLEDCVKYLSKSVSILPAQPETQFNLGAALDKLGRFEEAITHYNRAIALKPGYAEAYYNRGNVLNELGRTQDAAESFEKATTFKPNYAKAYYNLGIALRKLERAEEALEKYNKAIAVKPDYADAYYNKGNALIDLYRLQEALESFSKAIELKPDYVDAYFNRGSTLLEMRRLDEALTTYDKVLELKPDHAEAHYNRASIYMLLKRLPDAFSAYERAWALDPDADGLLGDFLYAQRQLAKWDGAGDQAAEQMELIACNPKVSGPFTILSMLDDPELHRKVSEHHTTTRYPASSIAPPITPYPRRDKIRVGYFSSDFGNHPVTHLLAGVLEHHDKSRFEISAFAFGSERQDPWRKRVVDAADRFLNLGNMPMDEIAKQARDLEIDIAIDLNGYTTEARTRIFAQRAAPIQASYIGFIGTMGAPYIDYLIADRIGIPESHRRFYSEKVVYLDTFQSNDDKQQVSTRAFTRNEAGLPENAFVFCSFNNAYKITPQVYDTWMRILKRVPDSVLWLYAANPLTIDNLKREAEKRGIPGSRLVFAERLPLEEHLARQKMADLFLDTSPYNAGATASNALRVGLPVLTRKGEAFVARMGASLLHAVGMPELVAESEEEYESLAVELATNPGKHEALKAKLAGNLPASKLFDTQRFTRNLEAAYVTMYERSQNGLSPDHIDVSGVW